MGVNKEKVVSEVKILLSECEPNILIEALDQMFESYYLNEDMGREADVYYGYKYIRNMVVRISAINPN